VIINVIDVSVTLIYSMALKLVTFSDFLTDKNVVTSGISVTSDATNIYSSVAATNLSTNGLYAGNVSNILTFRSLNAGSYISLNSTNTTIVINSTNVIIDASNIGIPSYAVFSTTTNGVLTFKSLNAGSYLTLVPTNTTITINSTNVIIGASNIGIPSYAVFSTTTNGVLTFKSLNAGSYLSLVPTNTTITINSTNVVIDASNIGIPSYAVFSATTNGVLTFKSLTSGTNIALVPSATTVQVNYSPPGSISNRAMIVTAIRSPIANTKIAFGASEESNTNRFILGTLLPFAGTIRNMYVRTQGAADTCSFAFNVNNVNTGLTVSITAPSTSGSNTITAVNVAAGDLCCFNCTSLATANAYVIAVQFDPT